MVALDTPRDPNPNMRRVPKAVMLSWRFVVTGIYIPFHVFCWNSLATMCSTGMGSDGPYDSTAGPIPSSFGELKALTRLYLESNDLSGEMLGSGVGNAMTRESLGCLYPDCRPRLGLW